MSVLTLEMKPMRELTASEIASVSGGDGIWGDVTGVGRWVGEVWGSGSGGEANVNIYVQDSVTNPQWTEATNNWLFDPNSQTYVQDTDGDGAWDLVGSYNGDVFNYYDGVSWNNIYVAPDDCDSFMRAAGGCYYPAF